MKSVVQIPAYNEPATLPRTARDILNQPVPEGHTIDVEAWVTRSEDESGCCSTMNAARSVEGLTPYEAPKGKLSARNAAHEHAVREGYDAFVSWDADAPPLSDRTLSALVTALEGESVVAANSVPVARGNDSSVLGTAVDAFSAVEEAVFPHINGQAHAITTAAWEQVGPFDETIDQTDMRTVRGEEEFGLIRGLRSIGKVVKPPEARVFNDPRRMYCKFPIGEQPPYCDTRGIADNYGGRTGKE